MQCAKCGDEFPNLASALKHCQREHGMTRQQAQNEIRTHKGR
jgi:hypothetical protein